jgi:hypothetical protein
MSCAPRFFFAVPRASGPVFMLCAPGLVLGGTEGVGSSFHVLHSQTHFRRYRGRRAPLSCFALPDSFSVVPRASGPIFIFCAPRLVLGGSEGFRSRFHILRIQTRFRRYRGRRVPFSCFAIPDSFGAVPSASGPDFMECAPGLDFGGTEGACFHFHVLRSQNRLGWYRGRQVPFSWFALLDLISSEPRASGPVFMFCAPGLIFGRTEGVGSHFHVLRSRNNFWLC